MSLPLPPADGASRLASLQHVGVLDALPDQALDDLTALAAHVCSTPIALITLPDGRRQWFKSPVGLTGSAMSNDFPFGAHLLQQPDLFIVPDVAKDERFADHPFVAGDPPIRFYAGAPLVSVNGHPLGALSVMDCVPRQLSATQQDALRRLGRHVSAQLELRRQTHALVESAARYRTLFEHAPTGFVLADAEGRYVDANANACRMFGYAREEFIRLHESDIVAPEELHRIGAVLSETRNQSDHQRESQFQRKDGSHFPADLIATRMPDGTLLGMIRDISDRKRADDYREHMAAMVESSLGGIIGKDLNGLVTSWNAGAEMIFGHTAAEMIGTSITRLIPPDRRDEEDAILERLRRGERVEHFETVRQTRDGTLIDVGVAASPIRDAAGQVVGVSKSVHDITVLKEREREVARLSRLYAALSEVNQAIVRIPTRADLFQKICQVLVADGGFRMAWIGWLDPKTQRILPVAACGDEDEYLKSIAIYADDRPEGRGPAGTAFRTGQPSVCNDMLNDPAMLPWRSEAQRRGFRAAAFFPIRLEGTVVGTLGVYAAKRDFFHDKEIALLTETANTVSFALDNSAREEARLQAEQGLRNEKLFSDTMIESTPGLLYFYDANGRFLRWNRTFEIVSGYSGAEIAVMHPRDFFPDEEKPRAEEAIALAFATRDSAIEAVFVAKDGAATDYYFTNRRVVFKDQPCLVGAGIDISERKRAEAALRRSLERFHAVARATVDAVWDWNLITHVVWWNENFQTLFGYEVADIQPGIESWSGRVHPDDRDRVATGIDAVVRSEGRMWSAEYRFRRKDGSYAEIFDRGMVLRDTAGVGVRMVGAMQDISERKRAESRVRESEARLLEAQRIAKIGSWGLDVQSNRLWWSDQIYEIFGISRTDFEGTYEAFSAFVHPADRERVHAAQQAALAGAGGLDLEHRIILRDGSEKFVHEVAALKRDKTGSPLVLTGTVHDITDRHRVEVEREKRHRAEAADHIKSAFLATMSHELRTPLNSILGFTGIVLQGLAGPLNAEQAKQLGMVRGSARHLLELINDVLDISKIEAGQLDVRDEPFNLRASIERVIGSVAPLAQEKGLALATHLPPGLPEMVSDQRRVEQILLNLLSNAIKFTDRGRVTLTVEMVQDFPSLPDAPPLDAVCIRVADTGPGIKPEDLASLFQPFRQLDTGLSRQYEGTGLGLTICRRLAGLMGGKITARSEWQCGSEFIVVLPLRKQPKA